MPTNSLIGFIVTAVVVAVFLWWTSHELRRVADPGDESSEDETPS